jgi:hypothetical protein
LKILERCSPPIVPSSSKRRGGCDAFFAAQTGWLPFAPTFQFCNLPVCALQNRAQPPLLFYEGVAKPEAITGPELTHGSSKKVVRRF